MRAAVSVRQSKDAHLTGPMAAATVARLARTDARDLLIGDDDAEGDELRGQAAALRGRLDEVAMAHANRAIDLRHLEVASADLRRQLAEVEARQAASRREVAQYDLIAAEDVAAVWHDPAFRTERQRAAVDAVWRVAILRAGPGRRVLDPSSVRLDPATG